MEGTRLFNLSNTGSAVIVDFSKDYKTVFERERLKKCFEFSTMVTVEDGKGARGSIMGVDIEIATRSVPHVFSEKHSAPSAVDRLVPCLHIIFLLKKSSRAEDSAMMVSPLFERAARDSCRRAHQERRRYRTKKT